MEPPEQAPEDRVCVTTLTGTDAFAMKAGPYALVHVGDHLPQWARDTAAGVLLRAVHSVADIYAIAELAADTAVTVPRQRGTRPIRR